MFSLQYFNTHETTARYNIAETCCDSISIEDLQNISENKAGTVLPSSIKLTYGSIRGSEKLRANLARLYSAKAAVPLPTDNLLVTPGAIAANFLVLYALIGKDDHVICHYPTYQQLFSVPESLGAEVSLWKAREERKWQLDVEELKGLVRPNTKMIIVKYVIAFRADSEAVKELIIIHSNPNNPTGAIIPKKLLEELVDFARERDLFILCDEVYRPIFHSISPMDPLFPPSLLTMGYSKAIVTGSLSKAYALAGIRVGWIVSRSFDIIESCAQARDFTTISVSQLDDAVASFALGADTIHALLGRNIQLAKTNLAILEDFMEQHRWACNWVKPVAGTTAFVKFSRQGKAVDDKAFCELLQEKRGVFFCPGSVCFGGGTDFRGFVRIGYVCGTQVLKDGLEQVRTFMQQEFAEVPLAS